MLACIYAQEHIHLCNYHLSLYMIHVSPAPPPPSNLLHKESDEAQRQLSKQEGGDGKCER